MLFARLQGQYIPCLLLTALFNCLSDQAAWQEAHKFLFCRHKSQCRCAIAHGIAKTHHFADGEICAVSSRGGQDTKRCGFSDSCYKESFAFVGDWLNGAYVFDTAKEVRLLDYHGGCRRAHCRIKLFKGGYSIARGNFFYAKATCECIGMQHASILWINGI